MKREFTVMGLCALTLLTVVAYFPNNSFTNALVLICEGGIIWAFVSAFRKA